MAEPKVNRLPEVIQKYESEILSGWLREQETSGARRDDLMSEEASREQSARFLRLLRDATSAAGVDTNAPVFGTVRDALADLSRNRARQGFTPTQVATFIFSIKRPIFKALTQELGANPDALEAEIWTATELLDKLGLYTTEVYQKAREELINRQQQDMLELSTPVVKLWDGVLALPLIGTLDSARTQVVMESLLERITETGSEIAIIDITGVPTVDTLVAQHLMKTVAAARLMGADCIISGIRPQIAQTIVHLGLELTGIATKASLASAFTLALQRTGYVVRKGSTGKSGEPGKDS